MVSISLRILEALAAELVAAARRRGVSKSALIRDLMVVVSTLDLDTAEGA